MSAAPGSRPGFIRPRTGLFLATLAGLVVVLGLTVPFPGNFAALPGGEPPRPGSAPRCLALSYDPAEGLDWLPDTVRLAPEVRYANAAPGP